MISNKQPKNVRCMIQQLIPKKIDSTQFTKNQSPITYLITMPHNHLHHCELGYRNSTIKQEQQQINMYGLQDDSSISLHEQQNGAYYYDLDYSDENINEGIVSSSDQNQREITHEEFMHMIKTNQQQRNKTQDGDVEKYQHAQDGHHAYDNNRQQQQFIHTRGMHSNQHNRHQHFKRHTSSTRDKSYQFHSYQINYLNKHDRNDPQKSSYTKNNPKPSSFNHYEQHSVNQFRIDSFLNSQSYHQQQQQQHQQRQQSRNNIHKNRRQKPNKPEIYYQHEQDESFSLITLPQYDHDESYSLSTKAQKQNIPINQQQQQHIINRKNIRQKYRNIAKLQQNQEENTHYQKLNWRYQQAKLKFMDSFLPQPLKIASNSYNMLKYINKKHELTYNMLML